MFDTIPETQQQTQAPPPQTAARERMGILRRFSEIGLRIAERIDRQSETAAIAAESPLLDKDGQALAAERLEATARSFARVARAVSTAIALEDRIERGPPLQTPPFGPELVCTVPRESALTTRRNEVEHGVRKAIDLSALASPRIDVDRLCRDLDNLLDREMAQSTPSSAARPTRSSRASANASGWIPTGRSWSCREGFDTQTSPPPMRSGGGGGPRSGGGGRTTAAPELIPNSVLPSFEHPPPGERDPPPPRSLSSGRAKPGPGGGPPPPR